MKKLLALILAAFMMISIFAACSKDEDKPKRENTEAPENVLPEKVGKQAETTKEIDIDDDVRKEIEKDVKEFVKAAILKEVEDGEYTIYEFIGKDLKKEYKKSEAFSGEIKSLEEKLTEKINKWAEDKSSAEKIKINLLKKGLKGWLEGSFYEDTIKKIESYDEEEKTAIVEVEIKRYSLEELKNALEKILTGEDDIEGLDALAEMITDSGIKFEGAETLRLELKKEDKSWIVTNDGSVRKN
ncbi:MAG: hypothetical protein IJO09_09470 [Oscillospiraceae bacterium]|nr:hypothetical protein [Oscillospiraceae bacterium]